MAIDRALRCRELLNDVVALLDNARMDIDGIVVDYADVHAEDVCGISDKLESLANELDYLVQHNIK